MVGHKSLKLVENIKEVQFLHVFTKDLKLLLPSLYMYLLCML